MRKLAPARVSYRHDFFISYRVYMMAGSFQISLFEDTFKRIEKSLTKPLYANNRLSSALLPIVSAYPPVQRGNNSAKGQPVEPRYNEVLGTTNDILRPSNSKIYGKEPPGSAAF